MFTNDDKVRLQRISYDQERVTSGLEDVLVQLAYIARERELNELNDPAAQGLLSDLTEGVEEIAGTDSPGISQVLHDTLQAFDATSGRLEVTRDLQAKLSLVPDQQEDVLEKLRALAARIDKWGDFTEVIEELRSILLEQGRVKEDTQRAVSEQHGR